MGIRVWRVTVLVHTTGVSIENGNGSPDKLPHHRSNNTMQKKKLLTVGKLIEVLSRLSSDMPVCFWRDAADVGEYGLSGSDDVQMHDSDFCGIDQVARPVDEDDVYTAVTVVTNNKEHGVGSTRYAYTWTLDDMDDESVDKRTSLTDFVVL